MSRANDKTARRTSETPVSRRILRERSSASSLIWAKRFSVTAAPAVAVRRRFFSTAASAPSADKPDRCSDSVPTRVSSLPRIPPMLKVHSAIFREIFIIL